jgi:hypothetical protein
MDKKNTVELFSEACFRECAEWAYSCLGGSRGRTATALGAGLMSMLPTSGSVKAKLLKRVNQHWRN